MTDFEKIKNIRKWLGTGSINIFGRPFSGKDTQGKRLAEMFGGNLVGGGEILRNSDIPKHVQELIRAGKLAPSEDYRQIVLPYLKRNNLQGKPLILSSLGRWKGEEKSVIEILDETKHPLKAVIYLEISENESHKRWLARDINNDRNNRHDDTEEILEIRFKEYAEKTLPVLDYYSDINLLIKVDGSKTRDEVTDEIIEELFQRSLMN